MKEVQLDGLDGSSPLAFLGALGALRVLDEQARRREQPSPRLSWVDVGVWRPVLHGPRDLEEIIGAVLEDHPRWVDEPAFTLAYRNDGARVEATAPGAIRDLKLPPSVMRAFLVEVAERAAAGDLRSARHAAAYGTDIATDNSGNTKPTSFHFTAGQQTFLGAIAEIQAKLTRDDVREALAGPWSRSSTLKTLGWDPLGAFSARMYALRASNPSNDNRPCVPGAEWLAFVGLSFFPTVPRKSQVFTTCVRGGWKNAAMRWPLWVRPATARTVESLLRTEDLEGMSSVDRVARGIGVVYSAAILRSDQGGYGSFAPSAVAIKDAR